MFPATESISHSSGYSRCCGNVGTRVLCGFPSSEGNARTLQSVSPFSALGASFPQQALDFVAFRTGCICEPVIRLKCTPFRKPRRMRTSPDSARSPNLDLAVTVGAKTLALQTDNYYRIRFTALNFEPGGELKPCGDLENRPAKVEYVRILRQERRTALDCD